MFSRMSGTEAEEHFWRLPEMVAYFLPYLDAYSLSSLACVLEPTAKILQDLGTPVLISIIKKSGLPLEILNEETLELQRVEIRCGTKGGLKKVVVSVMISVIFMISGYL